MDTRQAPSCVYIVSVDTQTSRVLLTPIDPDAGPVQTLTPAQAAELADRVHNHAKYLTALARELHAACRTLHHPAPATARGGRTCRP